MSLYSRCQYIRWVTSTTQLNVTDKVNQAYLVTEIVTFIALRSLLPSLVEFTINMESQP